MVSSNVSRLRERWRTIRLSSLPTEMTGDLDSETGFAIMELVSSLNREGMTIVFVTHDPRMTRFASRVSQLTADGKIIGENGDWDA